MGIVGGPDSEEGGWDPRWAEMDPWVPDFWGTEVMGSGGFSVAGNGAARKSEGLMKGSVGFPGGKLPEGQFLGAGQKVQGICGHGASGGQENDPWDLWWHRLRMWSVGSLVAGKMVHRILGDWEEGQCQWVFWGPEITSRGDSDGQGWGQNAFPGV